MAEDLEGRTLLSVGLDPTYGLGGESSLIVPQDTTTTYYYDNIAAIALQNGQAVDAGDLVSNPTSSGSQTDSLFVNRLTTGGQTDTSFGSGGTTTIPVVSGGVTYNVTAQAIAVQSDGKIDVLGTASTPSSSPTFSSNMVVARLNSNGSIDTSFGTSGIELISFASGTSGTSTASAQGMAIGPDGKIVVVGSTSTTGGLVFAVARLNTNGSLDTSFNGTGTTTVAFNLTGTTTNNDTANGVVVQSDSKIVVVGSAQSATSTSSSFSTPTSAAVARLNVNGTLDTSFNSTGLVTYTYNLGGSSVDSANAVALDGTQIVIVGTTRQIVTSTTSTSSTPENLTVTRLNTNGAFDTTFNGNGKFMLSLNQGGIPFYSTGTAITVNADGTLLVGGNANPQNPNTVTSTGLLLELTPTGALNTSYGTNGEALLPVSVSGGQLPVQTDGKVLFLSYNQVGRTTPPTPAAATTAIVTSGSGKQAKASGVTVTFNTAVNPSLLTNPNLYMVRVLNKRKVIKLKKKGGVSYNAATQTLTLTFAQKTKLGAGYSLVVTTGGIVGADGQVLSTTPIVIAPTTT